MKETAIDYIDYLLKVWAKWETKLNSGDIGWGESSAAMMTLEQGSDFKTKQFVSKMPPFNEAADRMRYFLNGYLQQDMPESSRAIKAVYLNQEIELVEIAHQLGIARRTLSNRLQEGKIYLRGCIRCDPFFNSTT